MPNAGISGDDYRGTISFVAGVANMIEHLPLEAALDIAISADTLGPIFLPTEWMLGWQNTDDAKELLGALIQFRNAARRIRARAAANAEAVARAAGYEP